MDFVVKKGNKISRLIQVCFDITNIDTKKRETENLLLASEELRCKDLTVITWDYESMEIINTKKIKYIPLWKWLLGD